MMRDKSKILTVLDRKGGDINRRVGEVQALLGTNAYRNFMRCDDFKIHLFRIEIPDDRRDLAVIDTDAMSRLHHRQRCGEGAADPRRLCPPRPMTETSRLSVEDHSVSCSHSNVHRLGHDRP